MKNQPAKKIDVSFGFPLYMKEYWDFIQKAYPTKASIKINENLDYTYGTPIKKLEESLIALHKHVGNAETDGYTIVVGHGASQIVSALAYGAMQIGIEQILLPRPYWGRLKSLLKIGSGLVTCMCPVIHENSDICRSGNYASFVTSPNNPDGSLAVPSLGAKLKVVDMCYNWPQYMKAVVKGNADVMIFGLSKATGHAGTRLGWALVKDPVLAEHMGEFVHLSTCGMSSDVQVRAASVIDTVLSAKKREIPDCFAFAKNKLRGRWAEFLHKTRNREDFKVLNSNGMFAWCQHKIRDTHEYAVRNLSFNASRTGVEESYIQMNMNDVTEKTLGLTVTTGTLFGLDKDNGFFRINLGCDEETFQQMMKALTDGNNS